MAFSLTSRAGSYLEVSVSGVMTVADMRKIQDLATAIIAGGDRPSGLVLLDGFQGWSADNDWNDISFLTSHGDEISRVAFVGDERWRDQVYLFTARGLRATSIEYFALAQLQEARAWVRG
ncbi:MAG: STAS/SEC14 domain-containing protein [Gammaproteobacteria bacterium]|nr:STAS/SEC14 domain-containing protein [Gammaproteobacteria bacterium]